MTALSDTARISALERASARHRKVLTDYIRATDTYRRELAEVLPTKDQYQTLVRLTNQAIAQKQNKLRWSSLRVKLAAMLGVMYLLFTSAAAIAQFIGVIK